MEYDALLPELRAFYEHNAATRDRIPKADWKVAERARFLAALRQEGKQRLLEIGAGTGHDSAFFRDKGLDVVCTDLSPAMAERCRAKGLTAYVMDFLNLDFPSASFDAVYALNCLLHVPKADLATVLHGIASLLRSGGLLFYGVYGGSDWEGMVDADGPLGQRFFSYFADDRWRAANSSPSKSALATATSSASSTTSTRSTGAYAHALASQANSRACGRSHRLGRARAKQARQSSANGWRR